MNSVYVYQFFSFSYITFFQYCFAFLWSKMEENMYYYFRLMFNALSVVYKQQKHYSMAIFSLDTLWHCLDAGHMDLLPQ